MAGRENYNWKPATLQSSFSFLHLWRTARMLPLACVLFVSPAKLLAAGSAGTHQRDTSICTAPDLDFDDKTNADALTKYKATVNEMLGQEQFGQLDCLAEALRSSKAKFASGAWKLHILYEGLRAPLGHATEEDWKAHLQELDRWVALESQSITARVALASAYEAYSWDARGEGASDTVSESGWRLFGQRTDKAMQILEQASKLRKKCPEWYLIMLALALDQGWKREKTAELLNQAIAFEPDYYYYDCQYADFLSPKWYGEEGDSEHFAAETADRGGSAGDILYFHIAAYMIIRNRGVGSMRFSWQRIQKGYAELEKQYGISFDAMNRLAYIATKEKDSAVASVLFQRIGDHWEEGVWECKPCFDSYRTWASNFGPDALEEHSIRDAANADMQTEEGRQLAKDFQQKFAPLIRECIEAQKEPSELHPIEMLIHINNDGSINTGQHGLGVLEMCLSGRLWGKSLETPHAVHWLRIEIDPHAWLADPVK
ncbi:MAG TPA: hypothetical protein VK699_14800 [Terriglobales bacterium]|jgi:hypothetical protein|nr:hypothetical protein [Terriglobales bacterium]